MKQTILLSTLIIFLFGACQQPVKEKSTCENKSDCKHLIMATVWYQKSAEMRAAYLQSYYLAKLALEQNLTKIDKKSKKPAVVFDIDETLLDNSPFEVKCIETGKGFTSETWKQWSDQAKALALPGAVDFCNFVVSKGAEVIYISNRKTDELGKTMLNMKNEGFPFVDAEHIFLKTSTGSKTERRNKVSEKYEIVLLVGDNLTDFSDEFAERKNTDYGFKEVDKQKDMFGTRYIILPNPMYGEWETAVYNNNMKISEQAKDSLRRAVIKSGY